MRGWGSTYFRLMCCASFVLFINFAIPAVAQTSTRNLSNAPSGAEGKPLYHDEAQDIYYDYNAVCDFAGPYFDNIEKFITKEEWNSLLQSSQKVSTGLYIYENNDIKISYDKGQNSTRIWQVTIQKNRLPEFLHDSTHVLSKFNVHNFKNQTHLLKLGCDAITVTVGLENNETQSLDISISSGVI